MEEELEAMRTEKEAGNQALDKFMQQVTQMAAKMKHMTAQAASDNRKSR
jgi:predicted  nucleic acid-binding Zn-ribbon protein